MHGELVPCGGGDPIPLLKSRLLVGRRSSCDISLRFPNVSSHHCELELVNGYWHVRDLNSRNGIKVNGIRCDAKWLMPGDVVSVAKHQYQVVYTPHGDAPAPEEEDPFAIGLLEKAGLSRRDTDRATSNPAHRNPNAAPPSKRKPLNDEDFPIDWFLEDNE
jgi:adenylate cyclase